MSRSGYNEGGADYLADGRWRGMVASAARGKRGQAFFKDLIAALDAMPVKELIAERVKCEDGVCAMGAVLEKRGADASLFNSDDTSDIALFLDIADPLAAEVAYMNDEACWGSETPSQRWGRMRTWAASMLAKTNNETMVTP